MVAEVIRHGKDDKIVVYKMKRRKGYRRKQGHRQGFTEIVVKEIELGSEKSAKPKAKAKPKAEKPARKAEAAPKAKAEKKAPKAVAKAREAPAAEVEFDITDAARELAEEHGIDLDDLGEPRRVFSGSAREGAAGFPANLNVAAALGLAGVGLERTELEIWADPTVSRNCHRIEVEADSVRFTLEIENVPSEANPRTGRLVANSVVATLRRLVDPLVIGT